MRPLSFTFQVPIGDALTLVNLRSERRPLAPSPKRRVQPGLEYPRRSQSTPTRYWSDGHFDDFMILRVRVFGARSARVSHRSHPHRFTSCRLDSFTRLSRAGREESGGPLAAPTSRCVLSLTGHPAVYPGSAIHPRWLSGSRRQPYSPPPAGPGDVSFQFGLVVPLGILFVTHTCALRRSEIISDGNLRVKATFLRNTSGNNYFNSESPEPLVLAHAAPTSAPQGRTRRRSSKTSRASSTCFLFSISTPTSTGSRASTNTSLRSGSQ